MSFTHTLTINHQHIDGQGRTTRATETYTKTGGQHVSLSESIPNGSTNLQVALALDASALELLVISADGAITVKTNNSSTPDDTFALTADNGVVWANGMPLASNPLSEDVTTIYVTNASGAAVTLTVLALLDATP